MRSSSDGRQFGDKLIPKIQSAVHESIISARRGLFDVEHSLRVKATQDIIDRAGHEVADLHRPIIDDLLATEGVNLHPLLQQYLGQVRTGADQWQSLAGHLSMMATSALSDALSNAFAPITYRINETGPNLNNDPSVYAQAWAAGLTTFDIGQKVAYENGLGGGNFQMLALLQQSIPDYGQLTDWLRRGYIDENLFKNWLWRGAVPEEVWTYYLSMARELLTPADMALALLRGDTTEKYAQEVANAAGLTDDDFAIVLANTGEPPGLMQLLEGYRRGFITKATLERGIRQSRVRDEWIPFIEQLRYEPMPTADAIEAYVKGYITEAQAKDYSQQNGLEPTDFDALALSAGEPLSRDEMTRLWRYGFVTEADVKNAIKQSRIKDSYVDWAVLLKSAPMSTADAVESYVQGYLTLDQSKSIAVMNGLREDDFDALRLTAGDPLSKTEMLTLLRRGEVTTDQVKDALRQSRLKDSYIDLALKLQTTLPALYEVRALLSAGAITAAQGTELLLEQGYSADLVKDIVSSLTGGTLAETKTLTAAQITTLYQEREITAAEYVKELEALGYSQAEAELYQEMEDWKFSIASRNSVLAKIKAQYINRVISQQQASADLDALQISAAMRDELFDLWNLEQATTIKRLTQAEITSAWQMNLFENGDPAANTQLALDYLMSLGYSSTDAIIVLEIKNKGPLGDVNTPAKASSSKSKGQTQSS
jgi:hypothetical protein